MPVLLVLTCITCITSHILCLANLLPPNPQSYNAHQPTRNIPPQTQNLPPYSPHAPPHQSPPQYNQPIQSQTKYNPPPPGQSPPQYNPPAQRQPQYNPPPLSPPQYNQPPPQAQGYCDPKTAPKCSSETDLPYCIADQEYPAYDIANKISQDSLFLKKYADKVNQSADDLIEGITKETEESFNYSFYTGASKGDSPYDSTNWIGPEGSLCPSEASYVKITRAVNVEGYWRIILQHIPEGYGHGHYNYTQTTRLETCLFPSSSCRLLAPCYQSSCIQQYVYHRMVAVDPCDSYRGFFVDTFKLPSACSCSLP